jgi:glyoxylase-like metal-dependent hydrolase (beta-lactamase superfamily II)
MRVHHLSCGSFCPHGARLVNGEGGLLERASIVCHCLLIEAGDSLVLVDTGLGLEDARNPRQLGRVFGGLMKPRPTEATTAVRQVEALGFEPGDVRHVVTTHLDLDHAGGLPDFPTAEVHLLGSELEAALHPALSDRLRYVGGVHWAHGPRWVAHAGTGGEGWFGFESVRILPDVEAEILLVPLAGHSRGHTGVAIRDGDGWLFHCGDAYFNGGEVATPPTCPPMLRLFQNLTAADNAVRKANQERLRELNRAHGDEVRLFCAHDPRELELLRAAETAAAAAG